MSKEEFINKLRKKLDILEKKEIDDIVEEYEGYIEEKKASGMSEEEAVKALGNIDEIVKDLLSAYKIKEDYNETKGINIINTFVDAILNGIDAIILAFKNKSSKEIARIIVKTILLIFVLSLGKIPFEFLINIGYETFTSFNYNIGIVLYKIWRLLLDLIYFCLVIIIFFRVMKEKIIAVEIEETEKKESSKAEMKKTPKKEVKEEVKTMKKEKQKEHSFDPIGIMANLLLYFVKFIVGWIALANAFYIACISCGLVISIYLMIKGVTYYGIVFLVVALFLFGISTFELLLNFIFDRKNNYTKFIIITLSSLIIGGAGMGLFATEIAQTTIVDGFDTSNVKVATETITMKNNLIFSDYYDIEIDDSLKNKIKIEYTYANNYIDFKISPYKSYYDEGYVAYHPDFTIAWSKKTFNKLIEDAKKKTFYNYEDLVKIKIFMSEENYNKIKENREKYEKDTLENRYCYYDEYNNEICEYNE